MRIAINGFGRIGRLFLRAAFENGFHKHIVAINDLSHIEDVAYLLQYDSVHGKFNKKVSIRDNYLIVGGRKILFLSEQNPETLPWNQLKIDLVVEATGIFRSGEDLSKHLNAGAKRVLLTSPGKSPLDITIVPGVNHKLLKKDHRMISMASCTTNCLAPMLKILNDNYIIKNGYFTTIHGYTSSQGLVDKPHKDFRRGRAAALNIIPTTTGAAKAAALAIPELKDKINGYALRVPIIAGSLTHLTVNTEKLPQSAEEINVLFQNASVTKELKNIVEYSEEHLVSTDILHNSHSCILDSPFTNITGNLITVVGWYDNEWGYCSRLVDLCKLIKKL